MVFSRVQSPTSTISATRSAAPVITAILAIVLAGCGVVEELTQRFEPSASAAVPPAPKAKPKRVIAPPPRPKPKLALAARSEALAAAAAEFDPETLIGLMPAQALAALGQPAKVQERSPSMVWRYNARGCALDLFFYMDLGANAFRVLAYDMKAGSSSDSAARACLVRFYSAAHGR